MRRDVSRLAVFCEDRCHWRPRFGILPPAPELAVANCGISTERDARLLPAHSVTEVPIPVIVRGDPQGQATAIGNPVGLRASFGGLGLTRGEELDEYIFLTRTFNVLKNVLIFHRITRERIGR